MGCRRATTRQASCWCEVVLPIQVKGDTSVERFKARLVARGFTQRQGEDLYNTYALVRDYSTAPLLQHCKTWSSYSLT